MNDVFTTPESPKGPKVPKGSDSSGPPWDIFDATPKYLTAGARVGPGLMLNYLASTLGGLAGPFARMGGSSVNSIRRRSL